MDYFSLLGLEPSFDLDMQALEKAYFAQQRLTHPDRFVGKPDQERQRAMQQSVDANEAYNTLKNPLLRAQYLLHLQKITVGTEADSIKPSPALLMETMEWREKIDETRDAATLAALSDTLNDMIRQSIEHISRSSHARSWEAMAQETLRLGYLMKSKDALRLRKGASA